MTDDRSDAVLRHQDAAGLAGMPVGAFVDGKLLGVLTSSQENDPERSRVIDLLAAAGGYDVLRVELLLLCHNHPGSAAVDCLDCVPLEGQ